MTALATSVTRVIGGGVYARNFQLAGLLFVLPVVLGTLIFNIFPTFATLFISFTNYDMLTPHGMGWLGQLSGAAGRSLRHERPAQHIRLHPRHGAFWHSLSSS